MARPLQDYQRRAKEFRALGLTGGAECMKKAKESLEIEERRRRREATECLKAG